MDAGAVVVSHGLLTERLNGRLGKVMETAGPRVCVRFDRTERSSWKKLKPENLRPVAAPVAAELGEPFIPALEQLPAVLSCCDARTLCSVRAVDRARRGWDAPAEEAWHRACSDAWARLSPRFHAGAHARLIAELRGSTWRQLYHHQRSVLLDPLEPWDLAELRWGFNFSARAGGGGLQTAQLVRFDGGREGSLHMQGYPPLPYSLGDDGLELHISNFPVHHVRREPSGEWSIRNENVVFISAAVGTSLRNFPDKELIGIGAITDDDTDNDDDHHYE